MDKKITTNSLQKFNGEKKLEWFRISNTVKAFISIPALLTALSMFYPKVVLAQDSPLKGDCIDTAIGCIPITDTTAFVGFILRWAIGVGGGIAFLLIVYAGFIILTSTGNPDRLKAGQELLTSAIMGLILLIFSVFILRVIGVDILKIPGFGQ